MRYDMREAKPTNSTNSGIFMRGRTPSGTQPFLISKIPATSEW